MRKRRSLRTKLIIAFTVLGLGPLALTGLITLWVVTITHRQDVAKMETRLLAQKIEEIDKFVEGTAGLFEIHVGYENLSIIDEKDQKILLEKLLEENKFILEATFVDAIGQETSKLSRVQDAEKIELTNIRSLPKFEAARSGEKYFGPVYYTLSGPMMSISAPVFNREKQVIMVLTGEISLSPLGGMLAAARLGSSGYVYLIDRGGTIIAGTDKDLLYRNVSGSAWIEELLRGKSHSGLEKDDRRAGISDPDVLAAGSPIPELGWGIAAEWPYKDAFSVVQSIQRQVIGFSAITIMVVALLGWLVGRTILEPLAALRRGAQKIGSGEFGHKIRLATRDEIEELGEVFNQMGDDLKRLEELKLAEARAEALAESLRKEKELSKMKDEFITNTSHQLRTPLSIMNWSFEMFAETKEPAEQKTILNDLRNGLRQLNDIVRDLLLFSEFGPGYKMAATEKVEIPGIIEKVVKTRSALFRERRIAYEGTIDKDLPSFTGSPRPLEIVLENLVDNALTYTPPDGRIKISAFGENGTIHLTLEDSGIGIPEKDKSSIFMQFFRAGNVTSMKNVGTGLGLYLSKNIIEAHGGKIWFESEENKGTKFHVSLPVKK